MLKRKRVNVLDRIVIGNLISFLASIWLVMSCWVNTKKKAYFFQVLEAVTLCVSSVFFQAWTELSTLTLSAVRNALVMTDRYNRKLMWLFCVLIVVFGIPVNNLGLIGLLPIVATVILAICNFYLKSIRAIKWSFFVNCVMWGIFSFVIHDYVSAVTQVISCTVCLISIFRLPKEAQPYNEK